MLVKIYALLRSRFPKRKSHSERALADLYKNAPKGTISSAEVHRAFDETNPYLRGQPMPGPRDYVEPICGDRLLATLNNDAGLEADRKYYYITHDNGRDFQVWKFAKPKHLSEDEIIEAYSGNSPGFRSWLNDQGIYDTEYNWMKNEGD